jgi:hypothetical protein
MRQRSEISGSANGALRRDDGQGAGFEQGQQALDHYRADAAVAAGKADHLQDHGQPDDPLGQGLAETATVRQDQVALQFEQPIVGNPLLREQAEAVLTP